MASLQKSNSQFDKISIGQRLAYLFGLLSMHIGRLRSVNSFDWLRDEIAFLDVALRDFSGKNLKETRVLELGFGQRPFRLFAIQSIGCNAAGIDLDTPLYRPNISQAWALVRQNGLVRGAKSILRHIVFDGHEYRCLDIFLRSYNTHLRPQLSRLIVGDLSDEKNWTRAGDRFDLIYSFDVFEHIPKDVIPSVLRNMLNHMGDDSIAVIAPLIFTGICGGHDLGWYPHIVDEAGIKRGPAWGHLTGETPPVDTFLNKITLAEFREIFSYYFDILAEHSEYGDLGRQHLTAERRAKIPEMFDESELFSNRITFVLRKKR